MPDWKSEIQNQLSSLRLDPTREVEIVEELSQHLDDRFDELVNCGRSEDEARWLVLQELNNGGLLAMEFEGTQPQTRTEPNVLGAGNGNWLGSFLQDARYGMRMLRKSVGFTVVAVFTLALGIGAATAIFTVAYGVLLKPLPLPQSERLVNIFEKGPGGGLTKAPASAQNYLDWKARAKSFTALTCFQSAAVNVGAEQGTPERWNAVVVHDDFFKVVGVNPALGVPFAPEHFVDGANRVAILSDGVWKGRFGGDPNILGRTISLNDRPRTIIGVMPAGFQTPGQSRVWLPKIFTEQELMDRNWKSFAVMGRLRDEVTVAQATSEVAAIAENLARDNSALLKGWSAFVIPVLENFTQPARSPLLVLSAAVGVVLLMACINVANLLLARGAARVGEIATRSALGAARGRLLRQLGAESLMLALLGGIAGCFFAGALLKLVIALAPAGLPRLNQITLDYRALAFGLGVTALTSLFFGCAPVWQLARVQPIWAMRDSAGNSAHTGRVSKCLVVFQIAASLVVLVVAGLLLRSFDRLMRTDLGFQPDELLTVRLELSPTKYGSEGRRNQFARALIEKLGVVPGVESSAVTTELPLQGWGQVITRFEGRPSPPPSEAPSTGFAAVSPDYFHTLNIPILKGRGLAPADDSNAPKVGLINQAFAQRFFPSEDPIGKRVELGFAEPPQWIEIIGIVRNTRNESIEGHPQEQVFTPLEQAPWFVGAPISVAIRTQPGAVAVVPALRNAVWSLDKDQPLHNLKPMKEVLFEATEQRRFTLMILGLFAALSLLLTIVGLYGVLAYAVSKRTRELGIRMALGAQRRDLFGLVLRESSRLIGAGIAAGLLGALCAVNVTRSLLYETAPTDPATFVTISLLLSSVALLACWAPAVRASRVDPLAALRHE